MSSDAEILAPRSRLGEAGPDPRRWAALVVMPLAAFMNRLDVSTVKIAIPSIRRGLAFLLMLALPARRGHSAEAAAV